MAKTPQLFGDFPVDTGAPARSGAARGNGPAVGHGDREFDDLVWLAARICDARWALLTLLDPAGQHNPLVLAWSGSSDDDLQPLVSLATGLSTGMTADGSAVVTDLDDDPRYGRHAAVVGPPHIRFCACIALSTRSGRRLGTLSVFDPAARPLTREQLQRLQLLAAQTATMLMAPRLQQDLDRLKSVVRLGGDDQHARLTLQSIGDGVVTIDRDRRITWLNPLAEHLTGWTLADAMGKRLEQIVVLRDEGGHDVQIPEFEPSDFPGSPITTRTLLSRRDGHEISIEGTFAPILADDRSLLGTVLSFRNVTVARKVAAQLDHQANHDALTGLVNRRALERRISQALTTAAHSDSGHALLYLDLDRFKAVNDAAGHLAGDGLLLQLAGLLKQHLRETDTLARLGGDEFGVLLEHCGSEQAERVAEKLRQTVEQFSYAWKDKVFEIGVSIGLVNIVDASMTLTDILGHADEACYIAKAQGRNRVHLHHPDAHVQAQHHTELEWVEEIQSAMRENRLFLCSQPIVTIGQPAPCIEADGHVEVLLRMRARSGAIVLPMAFIPAAERHQLMPTLDRWVFEEVLAHIVANPHDLRVHSMNLSAATLQDDAFADLVRARLQAAGVAPQRICFELAETLAIANLSRAIEVIDALRGCGCRFAIDDFGSGMSSFGYLKHLRVDYLKIDGTLVQGIVEDPIHYVMVESINRVGQLLGICTIAAFVEDDAILDAIRAMGVDCAQGYGVARPRPLDQIHSR